MEWLEEIKSKNRLLAEYDLAPIQGDRFQATNFPNLGPAEYTRPDGTSMLLVESPQSMANRMESLCWDDVMDDVTAPLRGMPYVRVNLKDGETNSILEAHRINSEHILRKKSDFYFRFAEEIGFEKKKDDIVKDRPVDFGRLYRSLFKFDPNSLVHGVFLEEMDGRLRVPRALSGFIEAKGVDRVVSGGVKFSRDDPSKKEGVGNVPYSRVEYVADIIMASFNMDISLIRGMHLASEAEDMLISLALYKMRAVMEGGIKLRTACDLKVKDEPRFTDMRGNVQDVPELSTLEKGLHASIKECEENGLFADPPVTIIEG